MVVQGQPVGMLSLRDLFLDVIHEKFEEHNIQLEDD
ncbi:MAG: hypothetical protein ACI9UU_003731 [Candidatus Azotimanducaceae bacterium]